MCINQQLTGDGSRNRVWHFLLHGLEQFMHAYLLITSIRPLSNYLSPPMSSLFIRYLSSPYHLYTSSLNALY